MKGIILAHKSVAPSPNQYSSAVQWPRKGGQMPGGEDSILQRRRLRHALRAARLSSRKTQKEVAEALDWSPSKVLRIEQGDNAISTTDLRALLALYETDEAHATELVALARASRRPGWA